MTDQTGLLSRRRVLGLAGAVVAAAAWPKTAWAYDATDPVLEWINHHASPLTTTDPAEPVGDLGLLRRIAGAAAVVGLGESTHGSREQFRVKHRMVRFLVERMGFRTVGMEHDFAHGVVLDRYVLTGQGDPRELVAGMGFPFWVCEEIVELVRWMRAYNERHTDKVRFLGTDLTGLRESSFEAVTSHVRRVASERLEELTGDLDRLRPTGPGHTGWYLGLTDAEQQPYVDAARRVSRLMHEVPTRGIEGEYARQHARTIQGWYENFANDGFRSERALFIADTIDWWQRVVGGRIAYWAANIHVTAAPMATFRAPWGTETGRYAGGHLRRRLGSRYVAIGSLFHHGSINSNFQDPGPHPVTAPPAHLLDATLGEAASPDYLLDLHAPAPQPVRAWRAGPATMRMIHPAYAEADDGAGHTMSIESLIGGFDGIAQIRVTSPTQLLG